jgi:pimeloyl-ACP methyl ester carboxylesterase
MSAIREGATVPGVTHHVAELNGVRLHHVRAGDAGSPVLLVHGWPETWWAFRGLIPLLAGSHRVVAVDLRGFGDSTHDPGAEYGEAASAEDLHQLVRHLGMGPVHVLSQDVSGGLAFRFAAEHPEDVASFTAIESTLAGFGLEALADVAHGGSWHLGFLGTPGIPETFLPGHERALLEWAHRVMGAGDAVTPADLDELERTYSGPDAWHGSAGLYQALFADAGRTRELAARSPLRVPVLAVDGISHPVTEQTFRQVAAGEVTAVHVEGVGHLVTQQAPAEVAAAFLAFVERVDA